MRILYSLLLVGVTTLIICGTVANICVHYTAASTGLRWHEVVIPRGATSALDPFDMESSLRQTPFLFNGRITTSAAIMARETDVYRSKVEEAEYLGEQEKGRAPGGDEQRGVGFAQRIAKE